MPKTRKERQRVAKEVYLDRRARYPHCRKPSLEKTLSEADKHTCSNHSFSLSEVYPQCAPVFQDIRIPFSEWCIREVS